MAPAERPSGQPLDALLLERASSVGLVDAANARRVWVGSQPVSVSPVDLCALALADLAGRRGRPITMLYPVPAGEAAVLLAAQILIRALIEDQPIQAVGLVTADPHLAEETWNELTFVSPGVKAPLHEAFPAWRAAPDGTPPVRRFRGVMIGRRPGDWRVLATIVEDLSGPVHWDGGSSEMRLIADPLSPLLEDRYREGSLVWGWDETNLAVLERDEIDGHGHGADFSPVEQRIRTIANGVEFEAIVCNHAEAERRLSDLRDDLITLSELVDRLDRDHLLMGLRAAWAHATTLASLPCAPSQYDRFSGVPPIAARATSSFSKQIEGWAATLPDQAGEYARVVASDIEDLRAALDRDNPFLRELDSVVRGGIPTLIVLRTRTAASALEDALGIADCGARETRIAWLSRLHRETTWSRVMCVGSPPRSALHRLESGLGRQLSFLVMGNRERARLGRGLALLKEQRGKWSAPALRSEVWTELTGEAAPPQPDSPAPHLIKWVETEGTEYVEEPDPFSPIKDLMVDDRPLWDGEAHGWNIATEGDDGQWRGSVNAVRVATDQGTILLEAEREVDVRVVNRLESVAARDLEPGAVLLLGRRQGRMNLIESLQETLEKTRPDLLAAALLLRHYKTRVVMQFLTRGGNLPNLIARMRELGCEKDDQTIRSWVRFAGPMGPRDFSDHVLLNEALNLGFSRLRLEEIFAGITRIRTFRRQAGRVLARAAAAAAASGPVDDGDLSEFGLTAADLRDAVVEVVVQSVEEVREPVPVTALNTLVGGNNDG